jgi:hypothetical protein
MRLNKFVAIPGAFLAAHSAAVVLMHIVVETSDDTEAGMAWSCCIFINWLAILDPHSFHAPLVPLLIAGGLQWILIGLLLAGVLHLMAKVRHD